MEVLKRVLPKSVLCDGKNLDIGAPLFDLIHCFTHGCLWAGMRLAISILPLSSSGSGRANTCELVAKQANAFVRALWKRRREQIALFTDADCEAGGSQVSWVPSS